MFGPSFGSGMSSFYKSVHTICSCQVETLLQRSAQGGLIHQDNSRPCFVNVSDCADGVLMVLRPMYICKSNQSTESRQIYLHICVARRKFTPSPGAVQLPTAQQSAESLRILLPSVRYSFRIFFSLNSPGLTPVSWVINRLVANTKEKTEKRVTNKKLSITQLVSFTDDRLFDLRVV